MVDIRPQDLNPAVTPIDADSPIIIDQGLDGVNRTTSTEMVNAVAPIASKSDAEVGTNDVKRMTALKTKQSIASEVGVSVASYAAGQAGMSAVQSVNGKSGSAVTLVKDDVGLGNVDNTSDANKPISTSTQTALNLKADKSVSITGIDGVVGGGDLTQSSTLSLSTASKASLLLADTAVQPNITITAGSGLTGGGTLAANRTLALSSASIASLALADSALQPAVLNDYATLTQLATKFDKPNGTTAQYLRGDGSLATFPSIPQGTITSVGLVAPTGFTVSNSPVTSSGNLTLGYAPGYQVYTTAEATKVSNLKSAAYELSTAFATAAQGDKADTAVQPAGLNKAAVGLGNVDNTSDANKPISTATQTALDGKASTAAVSTTVNGLMISADKVKLNGIAAGAQVNVPQVQTDWNATTGLGSILNKPLLGAMAAKNNVAISDISATGTANNGSFLRGDGTWSPVAGAGTVTSVAMTVPTGLAIAGSPITGAGTLAVSYAAGYQGYTSAEATKLAGIAAGAQVNTVTSVAGKTGAVALAKSDVGLGNVDNTSDANKPVSTAQQTALNLKLDKTAQATDSAKLEGKTSSELPISTATQAALNGKASLTGATFTGDVSGVGADFLFRNPRDNTSAGGVNDGSFLRSIVGESGLNISSTFWCKETVGSRVDTVIASEGGGVSAFLEFSNYGNLTISGRVNAGSKSFIIDHPLDPANKNLLHTSIETARNEVQYSGTTQLNNGEAIVTIDDDYHLMSGTIAALSKDGAVTSLVNQSGFSPLRFEMIEQGKFKIICQDETSNDCVVWSYAAIRNDPFTLYVDSQTDRITGNFIAEQDKAE